MTMSANRFYITGGTLPRDASSYVERAGDTHLRAALREGQFCYVLTSRQMGKSSLMVRTVTRLRQEGVVCVVIDLTVIGQNLDTEHWYSGILNRIAEQLAMEDQLEAFWFGHPEVSPLLRLMRALREVVLRQQTRQIVLFIDEIDAVRSLPFSADEFFAAIRSCHNRRTEDPEYQRLTFCLLGVASPGNLIRDTRTTPFNIGVRIDLTDFTLEEASPLAEGLVAGHTASGGDTARRLLSRVLYWTGGQPYLTQRLCQAVAADTTVKREHDVDRLCRAVFFSTQAREQNDNLLFVRDRILRSELDVVSLLDTYNRVLSGQTVRNDEANPIVSVLRLSGIVGVERERLLPRNRIYSTVFDRAWILSNIPGDEVRRQRAAYRRGVFRTLGLASVIVLAMSGLALYAFEQRNVAQVNAKRADDAATSAKVSEKRANDNARRADDNAARAQREAAAAKAAQARADQERRRADEKAQLAELEVREAARNLRLADVRLTLATIARANEAKARRMALANALEAQHQLYIADMNLIGATYERNEFDQMRTLLAETRASKFRGFEWGYWNRLCHLALVSIKGHRGEVDSVAFSPDGKRILTSSTDYSAKVWDAATGKEMFQMNKGYQPTHSSAAFSPDGKRIVIGCYDATRVWDADTGREIHLGEPLPRSGAGALAFSPDGKRIVIGWDDANTRVCDASTGKELLRLHCAIAEGAFSSVAYSPDGKCIVTTCYGYQKEDGARYYGPVQIWDANAGVLLQTLKGAAGRSAAFSPDGKRVVTGNTAGIWDANTGEPVLSLPGFGGNVFSVAFSPDGRRVTGGCDDSAAYVWDAATGSLLHTFRGHSLTVLSVAFSPNGKRIVTGSLDGVARVWNAESEEPLLLQAAPRFRAVASVAFSSDGKWIILGDRNQRVQVWDAATNQKLRILRGHGNQVTSVAISRDGTRIASGSLDFTAILWNAVTGEKVFELEHPSRVTSLSFSPDGRRLVTGCWDKNARVWDATTGRLLYMLPCSEKVWSVAYSPDGKRIVTGVHQNSIAMWDATTGKKTGLDLKLKGTHAVTFSPDGRLIASAEEVNPYVVRVWNAATGALVHTLNGHNDTVTAVAFSLDSKRIASGSADGTVRVWDTASGQELLTLQGLGGNVFSVAFSPDGKSLISGSREGAAVVWRTLWDPK